MGIEIIDQKEVEDHRNNYELIEFTVAIDGTKRDLDLDEDEEPPEDQRIREKIKTSKERVEKGLHKQDLQDWYREYKRDMKDHTGEKIELEEEE